MKTFFQKVLKSFDTGKDGFSARKLTAFVIVVMVIIIDVKWIRSEQWQYIEIILGLHFTFILALFGITTWQSIKNKDENNNSNSVAP